MCSWNIINICSYSLKRMIHIQLLNHLNNTYLQICAFRLYFNVWVNILLFSFIFFSVIPKPVIFVHSHNGETSILNSSFKNRLYLKWKFTFHYIFKQMIKIQLLKRWKYTYLSQLRFITLLRCVKSFYVLVIFP